MRDADALVCGSGSSGQGVPRSVHAPAPTVTTANTACLIEYFDQWQGTRTTAQRRAGEPGRRRPDRVKEGGRRQLLLDELGVLQTFPRGYPWQGSQREQHIQMGNAVPPRLAAACIAEALGL